MMDMAHPVFLGIVAVALAGGTAVAAKLAWRRRRKG